MFNSECDTEVCIITKWLSEKIVFYLLTVQIYSYTNKISQNFNNYYALKN